MIYCYFIVKLLILMFLILEVIKSVVWSDMNLESSLLAVLSLPKQSILFKKRES